MNTNSMSSQAQYLWTRLIRELNGKERIDGNTQATAPLTEKVNPLHIDLLEFLVGNLPTEE